MDWTSTYRSQLHENSDPLLTTLPSTLAPSVIFSNVTFSYTLNSDRWGQSDLYLNIRNVMNQRAPITSFSGTAATPGLFGGYALGDDPLGRYFNLGVHFRFN